MAGNTIIMMSYDLEGGRGGYLLFEYTTPAFDWSY